MSTNEERKQAFKSAVKQYVTPVSAVLDDRRKSRKPSRQQSSKDSKTDLHIVDILSEIENMQTGKGKFWRRRGGSSRMSLMSSTSQDSKTLVDVEEEFLHAAEFGDIPTVRRLLTENSELNVDCIDALGRTALRLAVKNEHLEVVEVLLEKSSGRHVYEAVLQAISAGHVQIAENILKHKRYLELWKERKKLGDDDHFFKTQFEESQFSPDITPLILASQKNQYEIVQLLLLRGEKVQKPHKFGCLCQECVNKMKFDQLRSAKYRLNAYRGLASEAYISLSSKDPILTAFQLSKELRLLSRNEKYFKQEYKELANQLSEYVVKLLDRVRTQEELELVLNKTGKSQSEKYSTLARFNLALQYDEKKFVAHPACQQRLDKSWLEGIAPFRKAPIYTKVLWMFAFVLAYPFITIVYIFAPNASFKFLRPLKFPWVKFVIHTISYISFLVMIVASTVETSMKWQTRNNTISANHLTVYNQYAAIRNATDSYLYGRDIPVRESFPSTSQMLISLWVIGFIYHECSQLYALGLHDYLLSLYNLVDFALLAVYVSSFTLQYLVMAQVHYSIYYFRNKDLQSMLANPSDYQMRLYWLSADRFNWDAWDPINFSEGLFAIANILSFFRISYLLPANQTLGPLQICVGRMIKDILKFLILAILVIAAFMVGLQNLFWYYNVRGIIEVEQRDFDVPAEEAFGDPVKSFRTVFWSIFGRGEASVVKVNEYDNDVTENFGYVIYGLFNIALVTVLLNMLIAMMARSYQAITEESDVEWKFARSQLYMEYISNALVLPVPLNLVRIPRAVVEYCCEGCSEEEYVEEEEDNDVMLNGTYDAPPIIKNGIEPLKVSKSMGVDMSPMRAPGNADKEESRRTRSEPRRSIPGLLEGKTTYQKVMQRIIQRYIFDIQREAEVTEDDFEEIKQDISSFRYEMLNVMKSRESQMADVATALNKVNSQMLALREDVYGPGSAKPTLKSAKDKIIALERRKTESQLITDQTQSSKAHARTLSSASDDNCFGRRGYMDADSRQDSLVGGAGDSLNGDDTVMSPEQVQVDGIDGGRHSDGEECIIVDEDHQKF